MLCSDTGAVEAVRFKHLDMKTASKLDALLGKLHAARIFNTRIMLFLNGGHVEQMEPFKVVKLPEENDEVRPA